MCSSSAFAPELQLNLSQHEIKSRRKKKKGPDIGLKRDETVKRVYNRRSSWLEGGLSDIFRMEDGSPSPAVEMPNH